MSLVSPILRRAEGRYFHWCPACEEMHPLPDSWQFNGDVNKPTFLPSFAQSFVPEKVLAEFFDKGGAPVSREVKCHYFITDGLIQFCQDSWHKRSDIVAMPVIPKHLT